MLRHKSPPSMTHNKAMLRLLFAAMTRKGCHPGSHDEWLKNPGRGGVFPCHPGVRDERTKDLGRGGIVFGVILEATKSG